MKVTAPTHTISANETVILVQLDIYFLVIKDVKDVFTFLLAIFVVSRQMPVYILCPYFYLEVLW